MVHGVILHSLRAQLHNALPSVSCGTSDHPTNGVCPNTTHNHLVFSILVTWWFCEILFDQYLYDNVQYTSDEYVTTPVYIIYQVR